VIDESSPIGQYLDNVTKLLDRACSTAKAQAEVITSKDEDPLPVLRSLATSLRTLANEVAYQASHGQELAEQYQSRRQ
jgi:hypothetical protein